MTVAKEAPKHWFTGKGAQLETRPNDRPNTLSGSTLEHKAKSP